MGFLLTNGQSLNLGNGASCIVGTFIGSGGQGEVYKVKVGNETYALKWYFSQQATSNQRKAIQSLVNKGSPSSSFLWPIDIVISEQDNSSFGYIMALRPANYKSLFDLMKRKAEPSFDTLITAAYNLADSFQKLHAKGLCYRDIAHGNIFFNEKNGDVLICDNDNVSVNNSENNSVVGTPRFMAPEVVQAEASPNADTDLFSLATLLFYMLFISHPLEGELEAKIRCFDQPAMNLLYGKNPIFIFDPNNSSNRPVKGYHDNAIIYWDIYPDFLKNLFIKAFTEGLDPIKRVRESEWKKILIQLRDSIIICSCSAENFSHLSPLINHSCWACKKSLPEGMRLEFGQRKFVILNTQTKLYPHHLDPSRAYDFSEEWATLSQHPQDPNIWGLKNLSPNVWKTTPLHGEMKPVENGRSVVLAKQTKVEFGQTEATIF